MAASNVQVGGNHYKTRKIQPHEYSHGNKLGWHEGEVVKYVTRFRDKGGKQDLEKAKHVIDLLIELEYPESGRIDEFENELRNYTSPLVKCPNNY